RELRRLDAQDGVGVIRHGDVEHEPVPPRARELRDDGRVGGFHPDGARTRGNRRGHVARNEVDHRRRGAARDKQCNDTRHGPPPCVAWSRRSRGYGVAPPPSAAPRWLNTLYPW